MPQGRVWSPDERRIASIAWVRATHDCINGKDQRGEDFWDKVDFFLTQIAPKSFGKCGQKFFAQQTFS